MKSIITIFAGLLIPSFIYAQGVCISFPASSADGSAILDIKSIDRGLLIPRMSASARGNIAFPAEGLMVYQNEAPLGLWIFKGGSWKQASDDMGNHNMTQNLKTNNSYISSDGSNKGIILTPAGGMSLWGTISNTPAQTLERFRIDQDGGFLIKSFIGLGYTPQEGSGDRIMYDPFHATFHAGGVDGNQWDYIQTAFYSAGFGFNVISGGNYSFATGYGSQTHQSYGVAMGYSCNSDGVGSVALGYRASANGNYSIALGQRANANGQGGTMVMCDQSTTDTLFATAPNQFSAKYAGGYRLFSNGAKTVGVQLSAGGSSWAAISDVRRKENFEAVNTEDFLTKLSKLNIGSWNYKGQDPAAFRHYGPMAQEIFAAYGKDKFGSIGCDTLLYSADMDGLMMIMLQGLEKHDRQQAERINNLEKENQMLKAQMVKLNELEAEVKKLSASK